MSEWLALSEAEVSMVNGKWIYDLFSQRLQAGWLVGIDGSVAIDLATQKLAQFSQSQPNFIEIATLDPIEFITSLMAGCRLGIPIFLGNPHWGTAEWDRVAKLTAQVNHQHQHQIAIPTGGSSGEIKFAIHSWETLSASVWGFQEFYEVGEINAVCILPLYHVSGLMQLWRSLLTDGKLFIVDFHQFCNAPARFIDRIDLQHYFISLVPTQLSKILDLDANWLAQFHTILLGGAPPSLELLTRARIAKLPLALTYGMTETASQVTSLKPAEFLAGNNSCGRVLPHAEIELTRSDDSQAGSIRIKAKSLMLGYFPHVDTPTYFDSDDLGTFDNVAVEPKSGYLTILGRSSAKIITGGENVFPIEVIEPIMGTGLVADVWVLGLPDRYWGQVVTAIYVPNDPLVSGAILAKAIGGKISNYKVPKQWISVDRIPRNSVGKILLQELTELIQDRKFET